MNTQTDGNIDFNDTSAYPVHIINSPGGEIQKIQSKTTEMGYKLFKLNGRLIDSKKALFDHIAKEMMFPDYFGNNWDALEECMRDLIEAVPASGYIVLFEDAHIFCNAAPDDFLTFVDIVAGVADEWIDEEIPLRLFLAGDVSLQTFNYGHLKERICIHSSNDAEQVETPVNIDGIEPFADFNDWFALVIEEVKPTLVVGIARGAIRLLQLQKAHHILADIPAVSDHALPFIPDSQIRSKRILLFDDSVIFGSTMSTIRDYLSERGAIVFCASYVVDRTSFYGETERGSNALAKPSKYHNIPLRKKHLLWPSQIRKHHDILIRSILQTPSHYNLDFPTFCFEIPEYTAADIPYLTRLLHRTDIFRGIFDVSTAAASQHGVYRYTALFEQPPVHLFPTNGLSYRRDSKARITFIPRLSKIQLTPIPQLAIDDSMLYEDVKFADETLQLLWDKLHPPCHREDPFYHPALFRLLTSFVAIIMGEVLTKQIALALQGEFPLEEITLIEDDIKFVTGEENLQILRKISSDFRSLDVSAIPPIGPSDAIIVHDEPVDSDLLRVTLETVKKCFNELRTSLKEFCPEYEVTEGDFPFSPDSSKRVLPDGSVEKILPDVYILTMDIIGSTDSQQTNECKDSVIDIFRRFRQHASLYFEVIHFEEIGNDAFVVCSEDPTILWDIATKIKVEGERLIKPGERFEGTRKGLSFGEVRVVEALDGRMRITDASTPHLLPRAFGIIEGIDAHSNEYS